MEEITNTYNFMVWSAGGRKKLAWSEHRWKGDVVMDLSEIECKAADLMQLDQDRFHWEGFD